MKTALFLEDTPQGIFAKFVWQGNGCLDNPSDSIAMHTQASFIEMIRDLDKRGLLVVIKDQPSTAT